MDESRSCTSVWNTIEENEIEHKDHTTDGVKGQRGRGTKGEEGGGGGRRALTGT